METLKPMAAIAPGAMDASNRNWPLGPTRPGGQTGPARARSRGGRPRRLREVSLLVGYVLVVLASVTVATLGAVYLVASVPVGLAGLLGIGALWLGVVGASPAIARRAVAALTTRIASQEGADQPPAVADEAVEADRAPRGSRRDPVAERDPSAVRIGLDCVAVTPDANERTVEAVRLDIDGLAGRTTTVQTAVNGSDGCAEARIVIGE